MWARLRKWHLDEKPANQTNHRAHPAPSQSPQPLHLVQDEAVVQRVSRKLSELRKRMTTILANGFMTPRHPPTHSAASMAEVADETKSACTVTILSVFPDICPEFLEETAAKFQHNPDQVIDDILSLTENGKSYPRRTCLKKLKRKREGSEDPDEEANLRRTYDNPNRAKESNPQYIATAKKVLKQDFPRATMSGILRVFASKNNQLLPAHIAIDLAVVDLQKGLRGNVPDGFSLKKAPTPMDPEHMENQLDNTIQITANPDKKRALEELRAARKLQLKRINAQVQAAKEVQNFEAAEANGTVVECGCCFGDFAMNRMVRCEEKDSGHLFCVSCARQTAENTVGQSKYELVCMSMEGCNAGFSRSERQKFLTDQLTAALDRIENEAVLRMAGIENLERCPFCPYAAEYPPVEANREFKCDNPECQKVSCRLCKEETHIPKTCEEVARDNGIGARHEIEEAMSAALIRKCNKCGTPFIKEMGCNKMTCTAAKCRNIQCYVCSKSCDYNHFDDLNRGGKQGNCPLFDNVDARHNAEVKAAEEKARQKVLESNRLMDEDLLKFDTPADKSGKPARMALKPRPAGRHRQRQAPRRVVQARPVQADRQDLAVEPTAANQGQNAVGQHAPRGNDGVPQAHRYHEPLAQPWDVVWKQLPVPQQPPAPGQVDKQNGFPAQPPLGYPHHNYRGFRPPIEMPEAYHFPAPQDQPQPEQLQLPVPRQPAQLQLIQHYVNWQENAPIVDWPANLPRENKANPSQIQRVGQGAPGVPGFEDRFEPALAPRELKRQKHRNKGAQRSMNLLAKQQANVQQAGIQGRHQAQQQVQQQGQQHAQQHAHQHMQQAQLQAPNVAALNINSQSVQRAYNPMTRQQLVLDARVLDHQRVQQQPHQEAQQAREQARRGQQAPQSQDQPANVKFLDMHHQSPQCKQDIGVPESNEPRLNRWVRFAEGENDAMDAQGRVFQALFRVECSPPQVNGFNPNLPMQPAAPDRPNWLMPATQQERARQAMLSARRNRAATAPGRAMDESFELD